MVRSKEIYSQAFVFNQIQHRTQWWIVQFTISIRKIYQKYMIAWWTDGRDALAFLPSRSDKLRSSWLFWFPRLHYMNALYLHSKRINKWISNTNHLLSFQYNNIIIRCRRLQLWWRGRGHQRRWRRRLHRACPDSWISTLAIRLCTDGNQDFGHEWCFQIPWSFPVWMRFISLGTQI